MPEVLASGMPVTVPRVVLDTNVLFAGLYSATGKSYELLQAIADGRLRLVLSTPLLFEYGGCAQAQPDGAGPERGGGGCGAG